MFQKLWTTLSNFCLWFMLSSFSTLWTAEADEENPKSKNFSGKYSLSTDKAIGEKCSFPSNCLSSPHVTCLSGYCKCDNGYHSSSNNTCISDLHSNGFGKYFEGLQMFPIMIVLGIMFIGMCVALNLFSRARFRNHRGIFANPRLLDLAKAQERRASQLSQLSGHQHNGLKSPTHSFRSPRNSFSQSPTHSYNEKLCHTHAYEGVRSHNTSRNISNANSVSSLPMQMRA